MFLPPPLRPASQALNRLVRTRIRLYSLQSHQGYFLRDFRDDVEHGDYEIIVPPEPDTSTGRHLQGTQHLARRAVPDRILRPPYARDPTNPAHKGAPDEETPPTFEQYRRAGSLASRALCFISHQVLDGRARTTSEIDEQLHDWIIAHNCYPSPLGYRGFPRSCCTSVNNVVAHGIPGVSDPPDRELLSTDIINIDVTLYTSDGVHGDTSRTLMLGEVDPIGMTLVEMTNAALEVGIAVCGPGVPYKEIGRRIEKLLSREENGGGRLRVVKGLNGHGIGRVFHKSPWIFHDANDEPGVMKVGDVFTIEPALVAYSLSNLELTGKADALSNGDTYTFLDGWTVATMSGARAAQAEHTVLITENGVEVLTREIDSEEIDTL